MTARKISLLLFFYLITFSISSAFSATTITISSAGNAVFKLDGTELGGVGGMDITIGYDTSALTNPRVVQEGLISGGMMVANTNVPGSVRIAIVHQNGISGTGPIATISFDLSGVTPGKILFLHANLVDTKGAKIASQQQIINPAVTTSPLSLTNSDTVPAWLGTVTMPSDTAKSSSKKTRKETPPQKISSKPKQKSIKPVKRPTPETQDKLIEVPPANTKRKLIVYKSVLKGFQDYSGARTPKAFISLFKQNTIPDIKQEPPVALSDGKSSIEVFIKTASTDNKTPKFILKRAKLVSLKRMGNNTYLLNIIPKPKTYEATVTVLLNNNINEFPLTIAPPLATKTGKDVALNEEAFKRFLKGEGIKTSSLSNNVDSDYINDYIFTANYLARQPSKAVDAKD